MTENKIDLLINESFNEFISKETRSDFIWICVIKKPKAVKYFWDVHSMSSEDYFRAKSELKRTLSYDDFYESVNYFNAKTIRSAYAKTTELLIDYLSQSPNAKVLIKEIEL